LLNKGQFGEVIASCFNFQNLNSAREAYKLIFKKDLFKILSFKHNFMGKEINSLSLLKDLIDKRHQIIHHGKRYNLDFKEITSYHDLLIDVGLNIYFEIVLPLFIEKRKKAKNT